MKATPFPQVNAHLKAPKSFECETLPVFTADKLIISRWKPTLRERLAFACGAPLWLYVFAQATQPPVSLVVDPDIFSRRHKRQSVREWFRELFFTIRARLKGQDVVRVVRLPDPDEKPGTPRLKVIKGGLPEA